MERSAGNDCSFDGLKYVHSEKHCVSDRCMICRDGRWDEESGIAVL